MGSSWKLTWAFGLVAVAGCAAPRTGSAPLAHAAAPAPENVWHATHSADHDADTESAPALPDLFEGPAGDDGGAEESPSANALVYARLDRDTCEAELNKRKIPFRRVGEARGVVAPVRLDGPLSGVSFHSPLPPAQRQTSPLEIIDCRLALALDDFARLLARHNIVEVVHLSVYRPASSKALKGRPGRRHGGALAIDAAIFKTADGRSLSVEKDFHGRIGAKPCPAPADASELRKIACEAHEARLFNVLLTPDYNWAHRNHFHLEVTAGVPWTLVR